MALYFNPAAGLAANSLPYALGGGRLADSPLSVSGGNVRLTAGLNFGSSDSEKIYFANGIIQATVAGAVQQTLVDGAALYGPGMGLGNANGRIQVLSHSALTGGIAFGSNATEETIFRSAASTLRTNGIFAANSLILASAANVYVEVVNDVNNLIEFSNMVGTHSRLYAPRATGWGLPTATLSRATFDPATVTLAQLAERVAALITDLHISGTHHALLNT